MAAVSRGHPRLRSARILLTVAAAPILVPTTVAGQDRPVGVALPGFPYEAGASFLAVQRPVSLGRVTLDLDGLLASRELSAPAVGAGVRAHWRVLPGPGLTLLGGLSTYGIGSPSSDPFRGTQAGGELHLTRPTVEAWLSWTLMHTERVLPTRWARRTEAGLLWRPGPAVFGVTVSGTAFRDSAAVAYDTVFTVAGYPFRSRRLRSVETTLRYADAEASADLALGPASLGVVLGVRTGDAGGSGEGWARIRSSVPLPVAGLRLEVSGGVRPALPERAIPRARFLSAGFRWYPASRDASPAQGPEAVARARRVMENAPVLEVVAGPDGAPGTLVLRNVTASSVEISGDFTDWEPLALTPEGEATWSRPIEIGPGVYHYLLRLDQGRWALPRGLPSTRGDFGQDEGVLLVG